MGRTGVRGLRRRIVQRWRHRDDDIVYHMQRRQVLERPGVRGVPRRRCWRRRRDFMYVRSQPEMGRIRMRGLRRRIVQRWRRRDDDIVYDVQRRRVLERSGMHRVPRRLNRHGRRDFMYVRSRPEMGRTGVRGLPHRSVQHRSVQRWRHRDVDIVYDVQRQRDLERPGVRGLP